MRNRKSILFGIILIAAAILIVVFFFIGSFGNDEQATSENGSDVENSAELAEQERDALIAEINSNANDATDLDEETAKAIMNLEIIIPDAISNMYFDGDTSQLCKELEQYLIDEDFYMNVTRAKCNHTVTMDHRNNVVYLDFSINDKLGTTVTVKWYKDRGTYKFNYY